MSIDELRFPVGKFQFSESDWSDSQRSLCIEQIAAAPALLRKAVERLSPTQLATLYRPEGWTVQQVVNHVPDSHMNAYVRFRLALTEEHPLIKPYHENLWAELEDAKNAPPELSLTLLDALHRRWIMLLRSMRPDDFSRTLQHPELGIVSLNRYTALYAWHGRHHTAHITSLREREGWN